MESVFQLVRFPVFVVGAILMCAYFPMYLAIATAVFVTRVVLIPASLVSNALSHNKSAFENHLRVTWEYPWFEKEYMSMWHGLVKWWKGTERVG